MRTAKNTAGHLLALTRPWVIADHEISNFTPIKEAQALLFNDATYIILLEERA